MYKWKLAFGVTSAVSGIKDQVSRFPPPCPGSGNEAIPSPAIAASAQRMALAVPLVEVTYDADSLRVRRNARKLNRLGREDFLLGGAILIAGSR
jgi:hypothetical protein